MIRRARKLVFAVVVPLALGACPADRSPPRTTAPPAASAHLSAAPKPAVSAPARSAETAREIIEEQSTPAPPVATDVPPEIAESEPAPQAEVELARLPASMPPDVDDDPEQLMGLDSAALEALLGEPGFRRDEPPAQVWQYHGEGCVLDVFLYTDDASEHYRVTYYEIRGVAAGARRRCLRGLLVARERG